MIEVKFHLIHVHASVWVPPRPIPTFQEPLGVPTPTYFSQLELVLSQSQLAPSYFQLVSNQLSSACLAWIMHGCMWTKHLFPPNTLSCTELTSCHCLFELVGHLGVDFGLQYRLRDYELEIQLDIVKSTWDIRIHIPCIRILSYVNYCNTRYYQL